MEPITRSAYRFCQGDRAAVVTSLISSAAVCLQTSFLTRPVGFAIFYLEGVAPEGVDVGTIYRGVTPFIVLQLLGLVLIFYWESLVTWLPAQAYSG